MNSINPRIYSFDYLRAFAMLLGIMLHSSLFLVETSNEWWIVPNNEVYNPYFYIYFVIHTFRMPIFFIMSGFFGSMLINRLGISDFLKHRVRRILIPFLIFVTIYAFVFPALYIFRDFYNVGNGFSYAYLTEVYNYISSPKVILNANPEHLWYLYYLFMLVLLHIFVYWAVIDKSVFKIGRYMLILLVSVIVIATFTMALFMKDVLLDIPDKGFVPLADMWLFYTCFYLFGVLIFKNKIILRSITNNLVYYILPVIVLIPIAIVLFFTYHADKRFLTKFASVSANTAITWLLSVILVGVFYKLLNFKSKVAQYISEASYWIYVVHLPLVMFLQIILAQIEMDTIAKFLIVNIISFAISIITYHLFVRSTFIGKTLNGKRYRFTKPFAQID